MNEEEVENRIDDGFVQPAFRGGYGKDVPRSEGQRATEDGSVFLYKMLIM
jgi:hypothetical protein